MLHKNKKGSEFVEASIIMPIVILAVIAVLWMIINLYSAAAAQASGHMFLREFAGSDSGTQISTGVTVHADTADRFGHAGFTSAKATFTDGLYIEGAGGSETLKDFFKAGVYGKATYDYEKKYTIGHTYAASAHHSASINLLHQSAGIRRLDLLK